MCVLKISQGAFLAITISFISIGITYADNSKQDGAHVNSAVAAIIARELIEASLFLTSHFGAVLKNTKINHDKMYYVRGMIFATLFAIALGGGISVGVGFGVKNALNKLETVGNGVESGEGASKLIGAFFVTKLVLKIPKWFGISNYKPITHQEDQLALEEILDRPIDDLKAEDDASLSASDDEDSNLDSRLSLSMSLFWNIIREMSEGGILSALAALLSNDNAGVIGTSVGIGIGSALFIGGGLALGATYISAKGFGVAGAGIAHILAVGLTTGAVRSFEEVYAEYHEGQSTTVIYDYGDTHKGNALSVLEFIGISDHMTVLQLLVWILFFICLLAAQMWHNYYGKSLVPHKIMKTWKTMKRSISYMLCFCFYSRGDESVKHSQSNVELTSSQSVDANV